MGPTLPRIPALAPSDFSDEQAAIVGGRDAPVSALNLTRTLVHHPALFRSWMPFAAHIGLRSTLPARDREVFVLRILALCNETYETSHHQFIARKLGLTNEDIAAAREGSTKLSPFEQVLVRTADELIRDHCIGDATWKALAERYTHQQLIELIYTGGTYLVLSLVTNSIGIQPEEDVEHSWKPPLPSQ